MILLPAQAGKSGLRPAGALEKRAEAQRRHEGLKRSLIFLPPDFEPPLATRRKGAAQAGFSGGEPLRREPLPLYEIRDIASLCEKPYTHRIYWNWYKSRKETEMDHMARSAKQLGHIVSELRREKGLTQSELGDKINQRQATISDFENGKGVRLGSFLDILSALDQELVVRPRTRGSVAEFEEIF